MFEYDDELKLRSLNIWGFDTENLDINKIIHVPMHQYRIATQEKTLLYVENLQCCIGLYAYNDNFGFAAHINPVVMRRDDYDLDNNKTAVRCRRIDDLKNAILESRSYTEPIKIGISLGCAPLDKDYPTVKMIYDGVDNLINDLNSIGVEMFKLEDQYSSEFILDTEKVEIILPKKQKNYCLKKRDDVL